MRRYFTLQFIKLVDQTLLLPKNQLVGFSRIAVLVTTSSATGINFSPVLEYRLTQQHNIVIFQMSLNNVHCRSVRTSPSAENRAVPITAGFGGDKNCRDYINACAIIIDQST